LLQRQEDLIKNENLSRVPQRGEGKIQVNYLLLQLTVKKMQEKSKKQQQED
jgi:hypothetical protein